MIKRIIFMISLVFMGLINAFGQAKKPTLMVMPSVPWCVQNGFSTQYNDQGVVKDNAEYEKALNTHPDLESVIIKVQELMSERGFPVKDLGQTIRSLRQSEAENRMLVSKTSGSHLAETAFDKMMNRAKADIVIEVGWNVINNGPKSSINYRIQAKDSYTNDAVATAAGIGNPSYSAEVPLLLEEAIIEKMDNFFSQLMDHFNDMAENGRSISFDVKIFDNGSGLSFEEEYGGEELTDIIDNWMAENTVKGRYNLSDATQTFLRFENVRIPLYRPNGSAMDARQFVSQLRKFLQGSPYNITSKLETKGLGKADLTLGEK